jgi:hypothetical protein
MQIPFAEHAFNAVVAPGVLEHVEHAQAAVAEISRVLLPDDVLVVTVPEFRFLWSQHDVALGHLRRYRAGEIAELVRRAGFKIRKLSFAMSLLFLRIALYRLLEKATGDQKQPKTTLKPIPGLLNTSLYGLLRLEA